MLLRAMLPAANYETERLEVTLCSSLSPEVKLSFLKPRKQYMHFCNPMQSKDVNIIISENN